MRLLGRGYVPPLVLPVTSTTVRLFVHVLAATVWVGGQLFVVAVSGMAAAYGVLLRS